MLQRRGQIIHAELRQAGELRRRVGRAVELFQLRGVGRGLGDLSLAHLPFEALHARCQPLVEPFLHGAVGPQHHVQPVRVVQQPFAQQAPEQVRLLRPPRAAGLEMRAEAQEAQRILAVEPASDHPEQGVQREQGLHFEIFEGGLAEGGLHQLGTDAGVGDALQGAVYQLAELAGAVTLAAAQADQEGGLAAHRRAAGVGEVGAQPGLHDRLAQRRRLVAGQDQRQNAHQGGVHRIEGVAGQPGVDQIGAFRFRLRGADRVALAQHARFAPALLAGGRERIRAGARRPAHRAAREVAQPRAEEAAVVGGRDVAVGEEVGVARMVVGGVVAAEEVVVEVGDRLRRAAALMGVDGVGQQVVVELPPEACIRVGKGALHFVVHDTADRQPAGAAAVRLAARRQVMALAAEGLLGQQRMEDGVEVHLGRG